MVQTMKIYIQFIGGAKEVTGSSYLLSIPDKNFNILIDAGMKQGEESSISHLDALDIANINAVFITHGHIDHTGGLPYLVKKGYRGPVYCTTATADVMNLLLRDTVNITNSEFYTKRDVTELNKLVQAKGFNTPFNVGPVYVTFKYVAHILGASAILFEFAMSNTRILFSGDIGSSSSLIHSQVDTVNANILVMESTYGNKDHENIEKRDEQFINEIAETVNAGGNVLIPTFAVGRAQEILVLFKKIKESHNLENVKVVFDTPMGKNITALYKNHKHFLVSDITKLADINENMFAFSGLSVSANTAHVMETMKGTVILSASGMLNGGKAMLYAKKILPSNLSKIIFVGYQAYGTNGRKLLDGAKNIVIDNELINVNAKIVSIDGFSAHAGKSELIKFAQKTAPQTIILVHGEIEAMQSLKSELEKLNFNVKMPNSGEILEYDIEPTKVSANAEPLKDNEYIADVSNLNFNVINGLNFALFGGAVIIENDKTLKFYNAQELMERLNVFKSQVDAEHVLNSYKIVANNISTEPYADYETRWKDIVAKAPNILSKSKIRRILEYLKQGDIAGTVDEIDLWVSKNRGNPQLVLLKDLITKNTDKISDLIKKLENMYDKWTSAPESDA